MVEITHYAFSDESYYTTNDEYGAIATLSTKADCKRKLEDEIKPLLDQIPNEYKWVKFTNENYYEVSKCIFNILFEYAVCGNLRIDVIIWETNDPRYPRNSTNTVEKLSVLYYLRLRDMMSRRWGRKTHWAIFVDEQHQVEWKKLDEYLDWGSMNIYSRTIFGKDFDTNWLRENSLKYSAESVQQVKSDKEPLVQIADIFAGMAAYSHNKGDKLVEWLKIDAPQTSNNGARQLAFKFLNKTNVSGRELWRNRFIKYVQDKCKSKNYQVSINNKKGLHTFKPASPFNFFYTGTKM